MLVLSRKEGERLVIGDDITLVISRIDGNRVSIGIEAPKNVKIMRSELATETKAASPRVGLDTVDNRSQGLRDFAGSIISMKRQVG